MSRLEFHHLANLFPLMTDEEVNDLGDDMLKHGQREPIWTYEEMILDGRNRYNACLLKGIEPRLAEFRGADPVGFVVSLNLKRRHLNESQRAMVMARLAKLPKGVRSDTAIAVSVPTQAKAAEMLKVSVDSGQRARVVIDKGVPDLVDAVEQGEVKVSAAAEFAKANPPQDQQRQIVEAGSAAAAVKASRPDVKAKADRAGVKQPKPMPDVRAAADRAERGRPVSQQPRLDQFINTKREVKSACDYNPEDPDDVAEPGDSDEVIQHRIFLHHASEALRHARAVVSLRREASPQEMTADFIEAAWRAAKEWSRLAKGAQRVANRAARGEVTHRVAGNAGSSR